MDGRWTGPDDRWTGADPAAASDGEAQARRDAMEQLHDRVGLRFRAGRVFKAHRLLYHSTLGLRVIKKKKKKK